MTCIPEPAAERRHLDVMPLVSFEDYLARWMELVARARGSRIKHFAYRMDDFSFGGKDSVVRALGERSGDTEVVVVLSPHALGLLNASIARRLRCLGVGVRWSPARGLGSMHIKATVFGPEPRVLLGSADIWSARLNSRPKRLHADASHEFGIEVGGELAVEISDALDRIARRSTARLQPPIGPRSLANYEPPSSPSGRVLLTGFPPPGEDQTFVLEDRLCEEIARARTSIYIEDQYLSLVHSDGKWRSTIFDALAESLARGCDVTVVLPSRDWLTGAQSVMGMGTSTTLQRLFEFRARPGDLFVAQRVGPRPVHSHSKVMVIDNDVLVTGSANLCRRSLRFDFELTVVVADRNAATASLAALLPDLRGPLHEGVAPTPELLRRSRHLSEVAAAPLVTPIWLRRWLLDRVVDPG